MDCPHCQTEMTGLAELVDTAGHKTQDWPTVYWCLECGTLVEVNVGSQKAHIPELQKLDDIPRQGE